MRRFQLLTQPNSKKNNLTSDQVSMFIPILSTSLKQMRIQYNLYKIMFLIMIQAQIVSIQIIMARLQNYSKITKWISLKGKTINLKILFKIWKFKILIKLNRLFSLKTNFFKFKIKKVKKALIKTTRNQQ
jgi:hypothetical protein